MAARRWQSMGLAVLCGTVLAATQCQTTLRRAFFDACSTSDECASSLCWQGVCTVACVSSDECGSSGECSDSHCRPKPAAAAGSKRVFVTSKLHNAALGGLVGADQICSQLANAAQLGGTWRAWLSDGADSPSTRFSASCLAGGPFVLLDGTVIAGSWQELTSGQLRHAIDQTETGGSPPATTACMTSTVKSAVWTATNDLGVPNATDPMTTCNHWSTSSISFKSALHWGDWTKSKAWSLSTGCYGGGLVLCSRSAALYCFEQ